jgi:hypothetical protein
MAVISHILCAVYVYNPGISLDIPGRIRLKEVGMGSYEYFMYSFFSSIGNQIFDMAKRLSVRLNDVMKIVAVFISFLKSF